MPVDLQCGQWRIASDFDSGNLASAELQADGSIVGRTAPDGAGTPFESGTRTWFYFGVSCDAAASSPQLLHMTVAGLNKQGRLYKQGLEPIVSTAATLDGIKSGWHRACQCVTHALSPPTEPGAMGDFSVSFQYTFALGAAQWVFFAFCYPHSYADCQAQLAVLDDLHGASGEMRQGLYYHRELLAWSLDGLRLDLLTVTGVDGVEGLPLDPLRETSPDTAGQFYLFPDQKPRPLLFRQKKVFFLTARVHPGETPASHIFNGFLEFILHKTDARAALLRQFFVFKLIPMLNPDGVRRGHYRADSRGQNLNRCFLRPDPAVQPTIYATRTLLLHYAALPRPQRLHYYVDLHAHANTQGSFIFGNQLDGPRQVENILFARLVALNSAHFDFKACNFTEENMFSKDKRDGLSKDGSGRVGIFLATDLTHCYTLESNYNSGRTVNALPACAGGGHAHEPASLPGGVVLYDVAHWADCGRGVALAALDMLDRNPWSRVAWLFVVRDARVGQEPRARLRISDSVRPAQTRGVHSRLARSVRVGLGGVLFCFYKCMVQLSLFVLQCFHVNFAQ